MAARKLAAWGAGLVILLSVGWLVEVALPERRQAEADATDLLLPADAVVTRLSVVRDGRTLHFTPRDNGSWRLEVPGDDLDLTADVRAVDTVRNALAGLRVAATIADDAHAMPDPAQFGVDPPLATVAWTTQDGRAASVRLGRLSPDEAHSYAALDDGRLVLLPRRLLAAVGWDLDHFRVKRLLDMPWGAVARIAIEHPRGAEPGFSARLVFEHDTDPAGDPASWRIVEPIDAAAADVQLDSLVSKLASLGAAGFGLERPTPADLAQVGLAPPIARVTAWPAEGDALVTLAVGDDGDKPGTVWARPNDANLVLVREDARRDLVLPDVAYRESRVFPLSRWRLQEIFIDKPGRLGSIGLRLVREGSTWRVAAPVSGPVHENEVGRLLTRLDEARLGRFEDDLAATPEAHPNGDFNALGAFAIEGRATASDGRPLSLRVRIGPPFRGPDGEVFALVAHEDQSGRQALGVMRAKALDRFLEQARTIEARAFDAPAPDAPAPPP